MEWAKAWEAVGIWGPDSPLITKQSVPKLSNLSLGTKREGDVCRLLRGVQWLFINAFMHAMRLELSCIAKLGTAEGTQLALRTRMKGGAPGIEKEKGDMSDDDVDTVEVDNEVDKPSVDNIPFNEGREKAEQSKGKGKHRTGSRPSGESVRGYYYIS
jgi:hypothetical protein